MNRECKYCRGAVPPDAPSSVCGVCAGHPRCEGCGGPAASHHRYCDSCAVLLAGIDEAPKKTPVHDGPWLAWAAEVRGCVDWFLAYGRERGFPPRIELWSVGMVAQAVEAKLSGWHPNPAVQVYRQDDPLPIRRKGAIK
jgi:hypothetical protein